MLYDVARFFVEFTRQPDEQLGFIAFGWLTMGQLLSLALSMAGALWWLGISVRRAGRVDSLLVAAPFAHHLPLVISTFLLAALATFGFIERRAYNGSFSQ